MTGGDADAALARRAAKGDRRAFSAIVGRNAPALAHAARGLGLPETDIDDAVQESFIAAWRALGDYDPARPFRPWLFRIAMNKVRDIHRTRRVRGFLFGAIGLGDADSMEMGDGRPDPERQAIDADELARTQAMLSRLDPGPREAIVLTAIVGLSQPEAAAALGISAKAIETRIARGRAKLTLLLDATAKKN